jgi:hypothetical protein
MAIDIRSTVTCSLGTLISGSISDSYLQGSGLVKTNGACEISGLITPAIGTVVTFSYTKGGVTRSIPRKLRVLSSFADPFRRTTTVELGCKLTYLSDLQEPVVWTAFDDDENNDYTEADQRIVTLPIHASSVMAKCLTELGITASSSPLTNKFSIAAFDFGGGYVQVLGDLLVSESYFGYLDASEVLQIASLDQEGGTGPVYTSADIVDLGPIGTGQLPGEAVTVSYNTLKLKQPEDNTDSGFSYNNQARLWERSTTTTGPITYKVEQNTYTGNETTETIVTYQNIAGSDLPVKRVTTETGSTAKIAGSIGAAYIKNGLSFNAITTELTKKEEFTTYDSAGNRVQVEELRYSQALEVFGNVSLEYVFSASDYVSFSYTLLKTGRTLTVFETSGDLQQETTTDYTLWPFTLSGQQAIAETRDSLTTSSAVSSYVNALAASGLTLTQSSVSINQSNPAIGRPIDIVSSYYAKDGDPNNGWRTESKADLELALGSATAQRRIEFSMPYAPDDIFSGPSGGPFTATPSDAPAKANRYGRVQNRLLLGNRSGVNLQLAPERLPVAPFSPLYLQADGLTALYRANGNQWAFDSNGIVCSTDALFWAAVGGTGTFWFPVAPGITTLPPEPPIVDGQMNASNTVLPYNETAVYEGRLRLGNVVTKFDYSLSLLTVVPAFKIDIGYTATPIIKILAPTNNAIVTALIPRVAGGASVISPNTSVAVAAALPAISSGYSAAIATTNIDFNSYPPVYIGTTATVTQPPNANIIATPLTLTVSSGATVAAPDASVALAAGIPIIPTAFNSLSFTSISSNYSTSANIGYTFTVGAEDLYVNRLSVYASSTVNSFETVRIWRNSDNTIVAQATVSRIVNTWSSTAITPVVLTSGASYTICYVTGTRSIYYNPSGVSVYSGITINANVFSFNGSIRPTEVDSVNHYAVRFGYA